MTPQIRCVLPSGSALTVASFHRLNMRKWRKKCLKIKKKFVIPPKKMCNKGKFATECKKNLGNKNATKIAKKCICIFAPSFSLVIGGERTPAPRRGQRRRCCGGNCTPCGSAYRPQTKTDGDSGISYTKYECIVNNFRRISLKRNSSRGKYEGKNRVGEKKNNSFWRWQVSHQLWRYELQWHCASKADDFNAWTLHHCAYVCINKRRLISPHSPVRLLAHSIPLHRAWKFIE